MPVRGRFVFKAHSLALRSRLESNKEEEKRGEGALTQDTVVVRCILRQEWVIREKLKKKRIASCLTVAALGVWRYNPM